VSNFSEFNYDYQNDGNFEMMGRLHKPENYDPTKTYSLVVYYHGSGSPGSNNTSPVNEMSNNLYNNLVARDAFIYVPQLPGAVGANTWNGTAIDNSMRMVATATGMFNIDLSRIYVTGYSLGGGASWIAMSRYHGAIAASAPGAGHISVGEVRPDYLVGRPIWEFHARDDRTVAITQPQSVINAIRAADGGKAPLSFPLNNNPSNPYYNTGQPYYTQASGTTYYQENGLRYTEYTSGGHGISGTMYNDANLYPWMYAQTSDASLKAGQKVRFDLGNTPAATPASNAGDGRMIDTKGQAWNSFNHYQFNRHVGNIVAFAVTTEGHNTTVMLDTVKAFASYRIDGLAGTGMDASISGDSWITLVNASSTDGFAELLFRGLTAGGLYDLELFASTSDTDFGRRYMTRYEIDGEYRDLQASGNVSEWALFDSIEADEDGYIRLKIYATPGSGSRYGLLGEMTLTAVPEPGTWVLMALGGVMILATRGRLFRRIS
jgi:poly(3-hydroxybutyrate) depolymerase